MKINFEKKFLKDLKNLNSDISLKLKNIILDIETINNISHIKNLKKIIGFSNFYRIRIGNYIVGIKIIGEKIIFIRIKHRKDIYKNFP